MSARPIQQRARHSCDCRRLIIVPACRRTLACALAGLLAASAHAATFVAQQIRSTSIALAQGYTRIELESDKPIRFVLHPTGDRKRVLLELADVEPGPALRELGDKVGRNNPYIESIQTLHPGAQAVILEFTLRGRVKARAVPLPPEAAHGHRLVLDLYSSSSTSDGTTAENIPGPSARGEETWLAVHLNRQKPGETALFLMTPDHYLSARREDLLRWRLQVPSAVAFLHQGEEYVPLEALPGLSYHLDVTSQSLDLQAPARLFGNTDLRARSSEFSLPMPTAAGGFMNYDVFANRGESDSKTKLNGLFELGTYGGWGVATSSFVHRDLGNQADTIRLDSTWTLDRPARMTSLRVGDAISRPATWGGSVRFGGVQWSTNFATQPGFNAMPLPGLTGEAILPSTVDLYINDALRLRRDVPPGPFTLQDLPIISGQGEARVVVRDILGREKVIAQPFYASPRLLRQGLQDYSYEIGSVRENYGLTSDDYGRSMAAGTYRLGLSDQLTGELHAEVLHDQQTAGAGAVQLLSGIGVVSASAAASHNEAGNGQLLALGFERQARLLSVGLSGQFASEHFTYLGLQPGEPAPRQISRAYASISTGRHGSLGLAYTVEDRRDRPTVQLVNANFNLKVLHSASLSLYALHSLGADSETTVGLTFTQPLGSMTSYSATATERSGDTQGYLQLQRNLPAGTGFGYRLRAGMSDDTDSQQATLNAQNDVGTYTLEAARYDDQKGLRAGASGGVVLVRDGVYPSRRISDSFAVVHVPDYPNVRIYADNQLVARTGADGSALVPRLRAFQKNPIRIEQADLPLDAQVDQVQFDAVPAFRSGLALEFPVRRSRGATLTLLLDNGQPMPAGSVARIAQGQETFPVGERGQLYLSGLVQNNQVTVSWHGQSCTLDVALPNGSDPLPDLGTYTCAGVRP